jgi:branched-chain amino acid aminotransferase
MSSIFYIDGEYVNQENAKISATDLVILRGYGVFDFLRTYNRKPFHLEAHVARLYRSAELVLLDTPWTQAEVCDIVNETIARNSHAECDVRIVITGGESPTNLMPVGESRLLVYVGAVKPLPQEHYDNGVKIITVPDIRSYPGVKSIDYLSAIVALKQARSQDAIDAVFIDGDKNIREGTTNNLFAFFGNTLVTPPLDNILPGITRSVVLDLAKEAFTVEERMLTLEEVYQADEVFLTSSVKEVLPIRQVDDHVIGDGKPGEGTQQLISMFDAYTHKISQ